MRNQDINSEKAKDDFEYSTQNIPSHWAQDVCYLNRNSNISTKEKACETVL